MTQHLFSFLTSSSLHNIFSVSQHVFFKSNTVFKHYINRSSCITLLLYSQYSVIVIFKESSIIIHVLKLIASSQVLKFRLSTQFEKYWVKLNFFWKSVELNWEVELKNSSRVEKLDLITWLENSTWFDKILDRCK